MKFIDSYIISILLICFSFVSTAQTDSNTYKKVYSDTEVSIKVKQLSDDCWRLRELYSDSSLLLGLEALELAEQYNLNENIAQICNYIGVVYHLYLYKHKESIPYFHKSLENSLLMKDSIQLAYVYNNLGDVYLISGNIPLALQYAQLSLELSEILNNKYLAAYAYMNLGEVYREKKEYQKSLDCFKMATVVQKELRASPRMGYVFYNIAQTHVESGEIDTAMVYYQKSIDCSTSSSNFRYVSWSLNGIADIFYNQSDYERALKYYKKALDWNQERNHTFGIIDNYIGIGLVYAQMNRSKEGEALLNKALSVALKLGVNSQIIKAYNSYIEFYKISNDYENVLRSFDIFLSQYDSILTVQQFEIANILESNYSMQHDLVETEQQLEINNAFRLRLIIIIVFMVVVLVVFIFLYQSNKKMNSKLAEMNKTKDKLFSVISHDLKSPFNILIGFSTILLQEIENRNFEKAHKYAGYLNNASLEGLSFLTNLLNWTLSQCGGFNFNPKLIDVNELFNDQKDIFRTQVEKNNVKLEFENAINNNITADQDILKIILFNLIANALKYTEENGVISVSANQENNIVKIRVKDNGIGMTAETLAQLFDKKSFIESKKGLRNEKGTGLGISIVCDLIKLHNGSVVATSEEGVGSTFDIEFPYK